MTKLNTYDLNTTVDVAFQMLGIIPGAGSTFQTVRVSPAALIAFIQQHSAAVDGREVEMQKSATHVQWRYVGEETWINLIPLADITGPSGANGADGDEVEMRTNSTHVQWKLLSASVWNNLIPLADLKGEAGTGLTNRGVWAAGTFNPGDYVFAAGSIGSGNAMWVLSDSAPYASSVQPKDDATHWIEQAAPAGPAGDDGLSVELQKSATHIQWRQTGGIWANLVPLADLVGAPGNAGANGKTVLTTSGAPSAGTGTDGDFAYDPTAMTMYGPKAAGAWPVGVLLKGTAGSAGTAGSKWFTGTNVPAAGIGADGDFYLRSNGDYYGPKASGAWGAVVGSLKGPAGSGGGSGGGVISGVYTLANNTVKEFTVASGAGGMFAVYHESLGSTPASIFMFEAGATLRLFGVVQGSVASVVGPLTGTTGTEGSITAGVANGKLYVENRKGWPINIKIFASVPEV